MQTINIRCSMLSSYADCPRRSSAKQFRNIIEERGFKLRELPASIGASVGTGYHGAVKTSMTEKLKTGISAKKTDAVDSGITEYRNAIENGVMWDATTNNSNTAEKQIIQLTNVFYAQAEPEILPTRVESPYKAKITSETVITGRPDIETLYTIEDEKSGVITRSCHAQLGGYSLQRRTAGGTMPEKLIQRFNPRVSLKKTHPGISVFEYNTKLCEAEAMKTIKRIIADVKEFLNTRNPMCFPANPLSMMCSDKYCPAWGTKFCQLGKQ